MCLRGHRHWFALRYDASTMKRYGVENYVIRSVQVQFSAKLIKMLETEGSY